MLGEDNTEGRRGAEEDKVTKVNRVVLEMIRQARGYLVGTVTMEIFENGAPAGQTNGPIGSSSLRAVHLSKLFNFCRLAINCSSSRRSLRIRNKIVQGSQL